MSPHKLRKTRKQRGKRTVGWGQIGQHRKHGQKGGRKVGRHKHLWTYTLKYEPNYFGKKGFKTPQSIKPTPNTINTGQLDELADKLKHQKQLTKKHGKPYIDLTALGYQKLLAKGKITQPITVKINSHSENAAKKIQQAGGHIITPKQETQQPTQPTTPEKPEETTETTQTETQPDTEQHKS
jgi:large subunit ribosomal protein L15